MKQHLGETSSRSSYGLPFGAKGILLGAGALISYGVSRRSKAGAALAAAGGVLAFRATTSKANAAQSSARASFLLNASPQKAYDIWRNFENLPRFMSHLKSVRVLDGNRSEWIARGPLDQDIRWNAEITEDRQNERISWRALPESDVENSGFVEFRADPQNRGTFVTAEVRYGLPGGPLGVGLATVLGKNPDFVVREDLRRFKALVEAGETPTTVGQTHGPRGIHGHAEQILFRETSNHPQPQAPSEVPRSA